MSLARTDGHLLPVSTHPVHRGGAGAARRGGVPEAALMTDEDLAGAEVVAARLGQRVGAGVIHFPAVVCTSAPSTTIAYDRVPTGEIRFAVCPVNNACKPDGQNAPPAPPAPLESGGSDWRPRRRSLWRPRSVCTRRTSRTARRYRSSGVRRRSRTRSRHTKAATATAITRTTASPTPTTTVWPPVMSANLTLVSRRRRAWFELARRAPH